MSSRLTALRTLLATRFPERRRRPGPCVPTGVESVDLVLGGGLAGGRLTEIVCAPAGGGGQSLLACLLASTRATRQRLALVDTSRGFDPGSLPPDHLRHLIWVKPPSLEAALSAADLLSHDVNYAALVLDLRGLPERDLRRPPATIWYRLQRATEEGAQAFLVLSPCPLVPSVPWRLELPRSLTLASCRLPRSALIASLAPLCTRQSAPEREAGLGLLETG